VTKFTYVDDAAGMAEFEAGRVKPVSVLKATGANVVVFAFDAGTELHEHTAKQPVLLQALEGALTVRLAGETVVLRPGDLLHIEPGVPHSVEAAERARLQLTVLMIDSPRPSHIPLEEKA
jgi:quercetin dioxygenase-like cupin family protein